MRRRYLTPIGLAVAVVVGLTACSIPTDVAVGDPTTAYSEPEASRSAAAAPGTSATSEVPAEPEPGPTTSYVEQTFEMPAVVGMGLQDAQDLLQSLGSFVLDQQDAMGWDRVQVIDSNWRVCSQVPDAGSTVGVTTMVELAAVKLDETCP